MKDEWNRIELIRRQAAFTIHANKMALHNGLAAVSGSIMLDVTNNACWGGGWMGRRLLLLAQASLLAKLAISISMSSMTDSEHTWGCAFIFILAIME